MLFLDSIFVRFVFVGLAWTVGLAYWFVTCMLKLDYGQPAIDLGWVLFGVTALVYLFGPRDPSLWVSTTEEGAPR